tara:strand:+ start:2836 stop:3270 length:435 start_codon:yes stop_codon:yes gene_type:complete
MFSNLFHNNIQKVGFEDIQSMYKNPEKYILINTLPINQQDCLIYNTISYEKEEILLNNLIQSYDFRSKHIVIYGKNSLDITSNEKCKQIQGLGFQYVFHYCGGLFEWLLLQDIYGRDEFPTTNYTLDILKYKPQKYISTNLIQN